MLIEVFGTGFVNKGAELMLRSILKIVGENIKGVDFTMAPNLKESFYIERAKLGLYQKLWFPQFYFLPWDYLGSIVPNVIRQAFGLTLSSDVNVVLDSSGFAYGDHCGTRCSARTAMMSKRWKKNGTKLILLPQAFGPFNNDKNKINFIEISKNADLIFARDKKSYNHIVELVGAKSNVCIAPDFTNLIDGECPANHDPLNNKFCIIPNYRMIDQTSIEESKRYLPFLIEVTKYLCVSGNKPFILVHEGEKDFYLANEIVKNVDGEVNIICESNPLAVKGIIGASTGVISSRFHGLVSALSQGVPALATGWSHKYEMLFDDYGFPEGMLSVLSSRDDVQKKIQLITVDSTRCEIKRKIVAESIKQKIRSRQMWDKVFDLISG